MIHWSPGFKTASIVHADTPSSFKFYFIMKIKGNFLIVLLNIRYINRHYNWISLQEQEMYYLYDNTKIYV
jgi:hypothetical protein